MATGTAALAQKLVSRKSTSTQPKKSVSSKNSKKSSSAPKVTRTRTDVRWQKIADMYNKGLGVADISDTLKLTRPKTKKGKENPYPYYLTVGYLTKLSHGVEL